MAFGECQLAFHKNNNNKNLARLKKESGQAEQAFAWHTQYSVVYWITWQKFLDKLQFCVSLLLLVLLLLDAKEARGKEGMLIGGVLAVTSNKGSEGAHTIAHKEICLAHDNQVMHGPLVPAHKHLGISEPRLKRAATICTVQKWVYGSVSVSVFVLVFV